MSERLDQLQEQYDAGEISYGFFHEQILFEQERLDDIRRWRNGIG